MKNDQTTGKTEKDKFQKRLDFIAAYQGDVLLDVQEVKMVLGVTSDSIVYDLLNYSIIPYLIVGSKKVRKSTLDKFLKEYDGADITSIIKKRKGEAS